MYVARPAASAMMRFAAADAQGASSASSQQASESWQASYPPMGRIVRDRVNASRAERVYLPVHRERDTAPR
jgi:hypothetical protein